MARYHERMREVAERHGGTLVKFIGDGAMSVFGVPVVHEDDALRAGNAALKMQAGVGEAFGLSGRVGVNTGEVIVHGGDVTGDAVNVAARARAGCEPRRGSRRGAYGLGDPWRVRVG